MSRSTPAARGGSRAAFDPHFLHGRPGRARRFAAHASVVVLFASLGACGPSEEERIAVARADAWVELQEDQAALNAKRDELSALREQIDVAGEGDDVEALTAEMDALDIEIGTDGEAFSAKLVNYINEANWELGGEMTEEQRAAFAMKSSEDLILAEEYVVMGGDYRRAVDILEGALAVDPDNADVQERLARYQADRYITAERFAQVKNGMTAAEVEAQLGKVFHRNFREFDDEDVFAWFYPKDPGEHGKNAAVGVFFREGTGKVYRTDFNAVKGETGEE